MATGAVPNPCHCRGRYQADPTSERYVAARKNTAVRSRAKRMAIHEEIEAAEREQRMRLLRENAEHAKQREAWEEQRRARAAAH